MGHTLFWVKFSDDTTIAFTVDGKLDWSDNKRSLYHKGARFEVVGEEIPKREKEIEL